MFIISGMMKSKGQFREAWLVNHRVNALLIHAVGEEGLDKSYAPRARNVRKVFVHIHNQRLNWLGAILKHPPKIARLKSREAHDVATLLAALEESGLAMADLVDRIFRKEEVKGFDRSPATFLAFALAHEAHHRGQVILTLRMAGTPIPREAVNALWDWDTL